MAETSDSKFLEQITEKQFNYWVHVTMFSQNSVVFRIGYHCKVGGGMGESTVLIEYPDVVLHSKIYLRHDGQ